MHLVSCGHFQSRDKDGVHTIWCAVVENTMLHTNFTAVCFIERELLPIQVLHCANRNFLPLRVLWLWPWPDDLHICTWPIFPGHILHVRKWTSTSTLLKVIVQRTDRQTYTHTTEIIYHAASRVAKDVTSVHSLTTGSLHCLWPPLPFFSSFHHTVTHINRFCGELQQTQNRTTVPVDYFCSFTCVLQNTKRTCWEYCRKLYIAEKKYSLDCIFVADSTCGSILNHFYLIDHRSYWIG